MMLLFVGLVFGWTIRQLESPPITLHDYNRIRRQLNILWSISTQPQCCPHCHQHSLDMGDL